MQVASTMRFREHFYYYRSLPAASKTHDQLLTPLPQQHGQSHHDNMRKELLDSAGSPSTPSVFTVRTSKLETVYDIDRPAPSKAGL